MKQVFKLWIPSIYFCILSITACTSQSLNDDCTCANGQSGTCKNFKDCPTAIDMVRNGGMPSLCGWNGLEPIVCCHVTPRPSTRTTVGTVSLRKCNETYYPLAPGLVRFDNKTWHDLRGLTVAFGVGGVLAASKEYKHMAALGYGTWPDVQWGCGGSLISEKFVMTAAHCIHSKLGPVKYIRLGDLNLKRTDDDAEPQDFNISRIIVHPNWARTSVYNDIALIELDGEVEYTDYVRPACLQAELEINPSSIWWRATGWGVTSFNGDPADHLQEMTMQEFPFHDCRKKYEDTNKRRLKNGLDESSQLCAGSRNVDTCQGDSGGPLQVKNYEYFYGYTVIGITSFGKPCGLTEAPGIYTRVSNYIGWIEENVWPEEV